MIGGATSVHPHFERAKDGIIGQVASNYTSKQTKRRFLIRYVFSIKDSAISSTTIVVQSTTKTITMACKEAIWLKKLFGELNEDLQITTTFSDH